MPPKRQGFASALRRFFCGERAAVTACAPVTHGKRKCSLESLGGSVTRAHRTYETALAQRSVAFLVKLGVLGCSFANGFGQRCVG